MLRNRKGILKGLSPFKHDDGKNMAHSHEIEIVKKIKGKIPNPIHSVPVSNMPEVTVTPGMEKRRDIKKKLIKGIKKITGKAIRPGGMHTFGGVKINK